MKSCLFKHALSLLLLVALHTAASAATIMLEGRYQQRNIFVINAASTDGIGYCIYEVLVNGLLTTDEINTQAFEIDLTIYGLKNGDPVNILIKHKDGCTPKILNPGALEPSPSFVCSGLGPFSKLCLCGARPLLQTLTVWGSTPSPNFVARGSAPPLV